MSGLPEPTKGLLHENSCFMFLSQFSLSLPVWLYVWYMLGGQCEYWYRRELSEQKELFYFLPVVLSAAKHQMTVCHLNLEEIHGLFRGRTRAFPFCQGYIRAWKKRSCKFWRHQRDSFPSCCSSGRLRLPAVKPCRLSVAKIRDTARHIFRSSVVRKAKIQPPLDSLGIIIPSLQGEENTECMVGDKCSSSPYIMNSRLLSVRIPECRVKRRQQKASAALSSCCSYLDSGPALNLMALRRNQDGPGF